MLIYIEFDKLYFIKVNKTFSISSYCKGVEVKEDEVGTACSENGRQECKFSV
jgi:hypothetical protein